MLLRIVKIFRSLLPVFASLLSSILVILTFPPYNLAWLGWIGLVPLFLAISGRNLPQGFLLTYLCGMVFFALVFRWAFDVPGYSFLHHSILFVYLGLYFGLFGFLFSLLCKRSDVMTSLIAAPFFWVSLEYIRSNMGFMGFPYALFGYSQHDHPLVIQIASLTGAYGVSFLLVMINSGITALVLMIFNRLKILNPSPNRPVSNRGLMLTVGTAAFLILVTISYGITVLSKTVTGKELRVSVVQGNIEQVKKWDRKSREYILKRYEDLSGQVSKDRPELIIWPETATPGFVLKDINLLQRITHLIREANTYFLIGSSEYPKLQKGPSKFGKFGNTALFFSPDGKVVGQYLKIRLLPFGEYLPYEETVPWSWIDVPKVNPTLPGGEFTIFQCSTFRFGTPICWENLFPELPREFVKRGAQFLANITNEAWFDRSVGPQHYVISSVFRAVENRIYVVRCANTGVSCFIDPHGRITGKVQKDGKDTLIEGYLTRPVYLSDERTFYTRHGDVFAYLCLLISVVMTGVSLVGVKR